MIRQPPECVWAGGHDGPAVAACTLTRPCGHGATQAEPAPATTCSRHLNDVLLPLGGIAKVATACPTCGQVNRARITTIEDLDTRLGGPAIVCGGEIAARLAPTDPFDHARWLIEGLRARVELDDRGSGVDWADRMAMLLIDDAERILARKHISSIELAMCRERLLQMVAHPGSSDH